VLAKSTKLASDLLIDYINYIIHSPLQIVTAGHNPAEDYIGLRDGADL
jgi:hypothetical protein